MVARAATCPLDVASHQVDSPKTLEPFDQVSVKKFPYSVSLEAAGASNSLHADPLHSILPVFQSDADPLHSMLPLLQPDVVRRRIP